LPHENALFWGLWDEGFNGGSIGTRCSALLPGINRRPNLCPPGTGPTRLRQEGWLRSRRGLEGNRLEIAYRAKQERAERKKVLALAQARKVDVILVTELTRWGRSAGFAARSLTSFKFRFVSSPPIENIVSREVFENRKLFNLWTGLRV
jgi:hypothetical protein